MNTHAEQLAARLGLPEGMPSLATALTHPSFANERRSEGGLPVAHNQRLEFLGDAVLGLCVSETLVRELPNAPEGVLSFSRAKLVSTDALAAFADREGVGAAMRFGRGAMSAGDRERRKVLADAVEALVGAAYLDGGLDLARALVERIVAQPLAELLREGANTRDPKSLLQELIQARGRPAPRYRVLREEGPAHQRVFVVVCETSGHALGEGQGQSKKLAEQAAAREALASLGQAEPQPELPPESPAGEGAPERE